eukprot:364358-Chlamydomonas_euryale.AAC.7
MHLFCARTAQIASPRNASDPVSLGARAPSPALSADPASRRGARHGACSDSDQVGRVDRVGVKAQMGPAWMHGSGQCENTDPTRVDACV